jgi:hypothetical protein
MTLPYRLMLVVGVLLGLSTPAEGQFDPFGGPRIRPSRPGMVAPTRPPGGAPVVPEPMEVEGGIVVAFLNLDRSTMGTLVEAKLRNKKIVNWWRKGPTARLLDDLELSTGIDVPPAIDDVTPGKLPDALIFCRTRVQGTDRLCEIVVCEPALGLRLGSVRQVLGKEVATDVGKLTDGTVKALGKLGEQMTELWAVPPLRSKDLGSKYESLRKQLADLIQAELLTRKGSLLVELEYAHAIALARKHAGVAEPLTRTSPIYLTGQYRNFEEGNKRTLAVSLQVAGLEEAKTDALPTAGVSPEDAEKGLRERVKAIAKNVAGSQEMSEKETAEEISTLANLAKDFQKSGDAASQLAILETSLLLKPNDFESLQESLRQLAKVVRHHWEKGQEVMVLKTVTEKTPGGGTITRTVPNDQAESQIQEGLTAMNLYRRGLQRIRSHLTVPAEAGAAPQRLRGIDLMIAFQGVPQRPDTPRSYLNVTQRLSREQREVALLLVRREAKEGIADGLLVWGEFTDRERMDLVLRLILELQNEPRAEERTIAYVANGVFFHNLKTPAGEQFLQQLSEIPTPAVQNAVKRLREQVAKMEVPSPTPMPETPEPEEKDADVRFVPLNLGWKQIVSTQDLKAFCELVIPAGKDVDLFCADGQVLIMKKKGEAKSIFDEHGQGYAFRQSGGFGISPATACFDGKYAWIPMMCYGKPSRLLVVDVEKEKVTELKADSGLPSEIPDKNFSPVLAAAPLAPGKAFLVGSFGKTWIGTATFDGAKGTVKIIHEAQDVPVRNVPNQWRNAGLTFGPAYVVVITDPASDKAKPARRMIIGRACEDFEAFTHPLLVDPDSGKVSVLETSLNPGTATVLSEHNGSLYWLQSSNSNMKFGAEFMKLGFPDFEPTSLGKQPLPGKGFQFAFGMDDKGLHVFHDQWMTAESPDQPLRVLKGNLPTKERTSPRFLMRSNHYGWVVVVTNHNKGYAVEFKK